MKRLKIALPVMMLSVSAVTAWRLIDTPQETATQAVDREPPLVESMTAQPRVLPMTIRSQGVVSPRVAIDLVAEVSGKIVEVHPAFVTGGFFKNGDTLLRIDTRDYEFAVIRAQAQVAEARKELLREEAEAEQALREWQALGSGQASAYVLHQPQLQERRAKLAAAQADLDEARLKVERCGLRAPFDGRVFSKQADTGQYVEAGVVLARLYSTDTAEVRLPIPSDQLEFADLPLHDSGAKNASRPQPAVTLSARFGARRVSWPGRIVRTEGALDETSGMLYAVAEIREPYANGSRRPPLAAGQFVQAEIEGVPRDHAVRIPNSALRSGYQVFIIDSEARLRLRTVEVLRREDDGIVVGGGLEPGDRVMIAGIDLPVEGMRVRIRSNPIPDPAAAVAEGAQR